MLSCSLSSRIAVLVFAAESLSDFGPAFNAGNATQSIKCSRSGDGDSNLLLRLPTLGHLVADATMIPGDYLNPV